MRFVTHPMGVCHKPLDGADVLLVPHVTFTSVLNGLGEAGQQAIIDWVAQGGHYMGWQGGGGRSSARPSVSP
eukprot:COSAG01_NODE_5104_length_4479_cov_3.354338_3_plen_72_part_00